MNNTGVPFRSAPAGHEPSDYIVYLRMWWEKCFTQGYDLCDESVAFTLYTPDTCGYDEYY